MCLRKLCKHYILNEQFWLNISRVIPKSVRRELSFLVECIYQSPTSSHHLMLHYNDILPKCFSCFLSNSLHVREFQVITFTSLHHCSKAIPYLFWCEKTAKRHESGRNVNYTRGRKAISWFHLTRRLLKGVLQSAIAKL